MSVYYGIAVTANIAAIFILHKNINVSEVSVIPIFLIVLMIFQARLLIGERVENGFRTAYGSSLTSEEDNIMRNISSEFLKATIPWIIPFVFFFSSLIKTASILIYLIGMVGGPLLFRMKKGKNIK